jgi:hypothetical protein
MREADSDSLPRRAIVPEIARDAGDATVAPRVTIPGPGYCLPSDNAAAIPSPPNAVFGLLTIGGVDAPLGTLVTLTFDGKPGLYFSTTTAGGYRFDYAAGGQGHEPPCINQVGSEIGLVVNGVAVDSGHSVGLSAGVALRFDVAVP